MNKKNADIFNTTIYIVLATVDNKTKVVDCFINYNDAAELVNYLNENGKFGLTVQTSDISKGFNKDFYSDILNYLKKLSNS